MLKLRAKLFSKFEKCDRNLTVLVLVLISVFNFTTLFFATIPRVKAQTNPIEHTASVSATMPDIIPPSTPILIAPEDGTIVGTNKPEFVWQKSTDNVSMSHYQLYLDGELAIDNINLEGSFTNYALNYDSDNQQYNLSLNYSLDEGFHTWKIVAVDTSNNSNNSATWTFEVDSIAPTFVLAQVGDKQVSISAQDESTVPNDPITLSANEPILIAHGEAGSTVDFEVIIPDTDKLEITQTIDSDGNWTYTLPLLPRDTVITLSFIITDPAMHVTALEGVKLIIESQEIVIPPPPTASPTPVIYPSPIPTVVPGEPTYTPTPIISPKPSPISSPKPSKEPLIIPYKPPKEVVHELTPPAIRKVSQIPIIKLLASLIGPILAALILLSPAFTATILLAQQFAAKLSWEMLVTIWKILGLIPNRDRQGRVIDSDSLEGVPFGKISFVSQDDPNLSQMKLNRSAASLQSNFPPLVESVLTDKNGLYLPVDLPPKEYKASVTHNSYRYPTQKEKPEYLDTVKFYQGNNFKLTKQEPEISLQIPVDLDQPSDQKAKRVSKLNQAKLFLAQITTYSSTWNWVLLLIASITSLFYPSLINLSALLWYCLLWADKVLAQSLTANIVGVVVDENGQPLGNALVELTDQGSVPEVRAAASDEQGRFSFRRMTGSYQLKAVRMGYKPAEEHLNKTSKKVEVNGLFDKKKVVLMMVKQR